MGGRDRKEKGLRIPLPKATLGLISLVLLVFSLAPGMLYGDHPRDTITGRVVNGTAGAASPAGLEIVLHVIGSGEEVDIYRVVTDGDGGFRFEAVVVHSDATYAVTATYGDVLYSSTLDPSGLGEPVELVVYETARDLADLHVETNVLLIRGTDGDRGSLLAFEVVSLVNEGDQTVVPDLNRPGLMNFLRFPLPRGTTNLEVSSDLPGGDVITVDRGFALTAPVSPGPHRVTYSYRIPYEGSKVELIHSFPMGAETFQLLLAEDTGELKDPGILTPQAPADLEGSSYVVWSAGQLAEGSRLVFTIGDLPGPPLLNRLGDALTEGPYLKLGIPSALGTVLAGLLLYSLVFRRAGKETLADRSVEAAGALPAVNQSQSPQALLEDQGRSLMEEIARLDDRFQGGGMVREDYQKRRRELKDSLIGIMLDSRRDPGVEEGPGRD